MAYTTINDSTAYFQTKLFTGNSSTNAITFDGNTNMQPDWSWFKRRDGANGHSAFDSVRGVTKLISPNQTAAEQTVSDAVTSFNTNGFTLGSDSNNFINDDGLSYVAWNWKANGAGSANTEGSINSTVSVNTTAGFSIIKYTATGNVGTIGHGLGAVPKMLIFKDLDDTGGNDWYVHHTSTGVNGRLILNLTSAVANNTNFLNQVLPTSTLITLGTASQANNVGNDFICYAFAEKTGYSKFGSYTANGDVSGGFVYLGFKPSFLMIKRTDDAAGWIIYDNKREGRNTENDYLLASSTSAEGTNNEIDLYSNGFKPREANRNELNVSGASYVYMAFGQSLVGSNNVPCTAR
jgi:hypothetical protein